MLDIFHRLFMAKKYDVSEAASASSSFHLMTEAQPASEMLCSFSHSGVTCEFNAVSGLPSPA
jgi:hypothetical protein